MMKNRNSVLLSVLQFCYWSLAFVTDGAYASFIKSLGYGEAFIGVTLTLTGIAGLIFSPAAGYIADRTSGYRILSSLSFILMGGFIPLVLAMPDRRAIVYLYAFLGGGFTKVNSGLLDSWITKLGAETPGMDFGRIRSFGSVAYSIMSVLLGRLFASVGYGAAAVVALVFASAGVACSLLLSNPSAGKKEAGPGLAETVEYLVKNRSYMFFLFCMVLLHITCQAFFAFFAILVEDAGGTVATLGAIYFIMAGLEVFIIRAHSRLASRIGERNICAIAMAGSSLKSFIFSLARSVPALFCCAPVQCLAMALILPGSPLYQSEIVDTRYLATAQMLVQTCCTAVIPIILSPVYGSLAESLGAASMIRLFCLPAFVGGLLLFIFGGRKKAED